MADKKKGPNVVQLNSLPTDNIRKRLYEIKKDINRLNDTIFKAVGGNPQRMLPLEMEITGISTVSDRERREIQHCVNGIQFQLNWTADMLGRLYPPIQMSHEVPPPVDPPSGDKPPTKQRASNGIGFPTQSTMDVDPPVPPAGGDKPPS